MKLDLQGGLAPPRVDKAGGGEDVVEGADDAFVQTLPTDKAKPGGLDVINNICNMGKSESGKEKYLTRLSWSLKVRTR